MAEYKMVYRSEYFISGNILPGAVKDYGTFSIGFIWNNEGIVHQTAECPSPELAKEALLEWARYQLAPREASG